jgi:uncharacterized damage-inducible protein DinB
MVAHDPEGATDPVDQLERSRRSLMDAIAGLDEETLRTRTGGTAWTTAELLAHLWSAEATLIQRSQLGTALDLLERLRSDDGRDEARQLAQRMPVPQIVHALLAQRRDTLRALRDRGGALDALAAEIARHEMEHAAEVRRLRAPAAQGT